MPTSADLCDTVVLDVDGTLVDSVYLHVEIWARAFDAVGLAVPTWRVHRAIGMGGDQLVAEVAGQDAEDAHGDEVRERHDDEFARRVDEVRATHGAAELVAALGRRPVAVVVASSGKPADTERLLELVGGRSAVDAVVASEDADRTKPAPDLIEVAVREAGGTRALVLGDATWDMHAGGAAGHRCVGLRTGGFGAEELLGAGATWVYDDPAHLVRRLADLPLPAEA